MTNIKVLYLTVILHI